MHKHALGRAPPDEAATSLQMLGVAPRAVAGRGRKPPQSAPKAPAADGATSDLTSAQVDERVQPVVKSAEMVLTARGKNAEEMERRLEMIPLTTLQLMTEVDLWQKKFREAAQRELEQRQKMESHQRSMEKLQVRGLGLKAEG